MPVYNCPRCGGPITDVAGMLQCPNAPCQYGHDEPRALVPMADPVATIAIPTKPAKIGLFKAGYEKGFELFWNAYPRKDSKAAAVKAWNKIALTPELIVAILDAIAWQREQEQWQTRNFIPLPATYLNGRRWEDEPPAQQTVAPTRPKPPPMSFKEQDRHKAAMLRRQAVRPGATLPPRPTTQPLPLPAYTGPES